MSIVLRRLHTEMIGLVAAGGLKWAYGLRSQGPVKHNLATDGGCGSGLITAPAYVRIKTVPTRAFDS